MFRILLKLAFKNVFRRKLQTYLLGSMIAITTFALFAMVGLQTGAFRLIEDSYTSVFFGDIQIRNVAYDDLDDFDQLLDLNKTTKLTKYMNNQFEQDVFFASRYIHWGILDVNNKNYTFQLIGIDPKNEQNVSIIDDNMQAGQFLNNAPNTVMMGAQMANFLGVSVNDEITIMTTDIYDSFVIDVFRVVGIYKSGDNLLDKNSLFINKKYFADNIVYDDNLVTNITVRLNNSYQRQYIVQQLQQLAGSDVEVLPWDEILPDIKQVINFQLTVSMFYYLMLVLVVAFSVLNAMVLSTFKRNYEFGILQALGLRSANLGWLLFFENFILSTVFVAIGSIVGIIFVIYFSKVGIPLPSLASSEDTPLTLLSHVLYPDPTSALLLIGPVLMYICVMLSIVPSLIRLKKANPIKSLTT